MPHQTNATPATADTFRREIGFYRDLGETVGVRVPLMYHGDASEESAIILLEDLSPTEPGDSLNGCTFEEAIAAVEGLGSVHAKWWNHTNVLSSDWIFSPSAGKPIGEIAAPTERGWEFLEADRKEQLPDRLAKICSTRGWYVPIVEERMSGPVTLSHQDYRLDNLFFDRSGDAVELVVIDWGRVSRQRPGYVLAFFLAKESDLLTKGIEKCIEAYWHSVTKSETVKISLDECMYEFRRGVIEVLGLFLWQASVGANAGADARIVEMRNRGWQRMVKCISDFDCAEVIPK